ncbi:hypothetical protein MRX96_054558 [Rhipicephalus microplus]
MRAGSQGWTGSSAVTVTPCLLLRLAASRVRLGSDATAGRFLACEPRRAGGQDAQDEKQNIKAKVCIRCSNSRLLRRPSVGGELAERFGPCWPMSMPSAEPFDVRHPQLSASHCRRVAIFERERSTGETLAWARCPPFCIGKSQRRGFAVRLGEA